MQSSSLQTSKRGIERTLLQTKKKNKRSFVSFEGKRVLVTARGTDEENSNKKPFRFYTTTEEPDRVSNFFILFLRKIEI